MTVKNIMFSGVMAAILMAGANAHAAVEIASRGYVDTEVAKKADATEFSTLKGVVENADTGLATKASKTELQTAQSDLQDAINLKANAADVYTKDDVYTKTESDGRFDAINAAQNALTAAQSYTDAQLKTLTDSLGGTGEDGESTGLTGIVAGHTVQIGALETKVGEKNVATQISEALSTYAKTADVESKDAATLEAAKGYTDEKVGALTGENGAITTLAARVTANEGAIATNTEEIAKKADKTTVEGIQSTINSLGDTYATDEEVEGIQTTLQNNIDTKVATETYNAKVAELSSAITTEKERAEGVEGGLNTRLTTAEGTISTLSNDLATKITKPAACQTGNCVLAMMNGGNPEWIILTLPTE